MWDWFKANPKYAVLVIVTIVVIIGAGAWVADAILVKPDPQVVSMADPMPNTGVDANGLTLDQWIAGGKAPKDYQPVRKSLFKAGDTLWVLRFDCFLNKTQDGLVSRAFLGGDGSAGTNTSVYTLPDMQIPTRTDGCAVKNHRTGIPLDLPAGTWRYQATVNFYKSPIQPSVRVLFKPVIIEVTK